jgi:hypothetical protein
MASADVVQLLDRQHERLHAQDGVEFVHELRRFYDFITAGPDEVTGVLTGLRAEASHIEQEFERHDAKLVPELVALKAEFVDRARDADDSGVSRPHSIGPPPMSWAFSFANFDQVATGGRERNVLRQGSDASASGMLIRILEAKLHELRWMVTSPQGIRSVSETDLRPELDDLGRRLRNISDRHRHAAQEYAQAVERHGGFQVQYLDVAVAEMNPAPRQVETDADEHAWMDDTFRRVAGGWHVMETAAAGRTLDDLGRRTLEIQVERLKPAAERVYEDLRLKLATAPPPPEPTPAYGQRLQTWVNSPTFALIGGPCIAGVVTAIVIGKGAGLGVFLALTVALAVLPPLWGHLPRMTYTTSSLVFAGLMAAVVIVLLVTVGLVAAVGAFVLLVLAFTLGQRTTVSSR